MATNQESTRKPRLHNASSFSRDLSDLCCRGRKSGSQNVKWALKWWFINVLSYLLLIRFHFKCDLCSLYPNSGLGHGRGSKTIRKLVESRLTAGFIVVYTWMGWYTDLYLKESILFCIGISSPVACPYFRWCFSRRYHANWTNQTEDLGDVTSPPMSPVLRRHHPKRLDLKQPWGDQNSDLLFLHHQNCWWKDWMFSFLKGWCISNTRKMVNGPNMVMGDVKYWV
jgi:hypothetical protein